MIIRRLEPFSPRPPPHYVFRIAAGEGWVEHGEPYRPSMIPSVDVRSYGRFWAVYIDESLLCVAVYQKGALAVKQVVDALAARSAAAKT